MLKLWEHKLFTYVDRYPAWLRVWGKRILTRRPKRGPSVLSIPESVREIIWEDVHKFEGALSLETPLWDRD